jgi:hypothetical protein
MPDATIVVAYGKEDPGVKSFTAIALPAPRARDRPDLVSQPKGGFSLSFAFFRNIAIMKIMQVHLFRICTKFLSHVQNPNPGESRAKVGEACRAKRASMTWPS